MSSEISKLHFNMPAAQHVTTSATKQNTSLTSLRESLRNARPEQTAKNTGANTLAWYKIGLRNSLDEGFRKFLSLDISEKQPKANLKKQNPATAQTNSKQNLGSSSNSTKTVGKSVYSKKFQKVSEEATKQTGNPKQLQREDSRTRSLTNAAEKSTAGKTAPDRSTPDRSASTRSMPDRSGSERTISDKTTQSSSDGSRSSAKTRLPYTQARQAAINLNDKIKQGAKSKSETDFKQHLRQPTQQQTQNIKNTKSSETQSSGRTQSFNSASSKGDMEQAPQSQNIVRNKNTISLSIIQNHMSNNFRTKILGSNQHIDSSKSTSQNSEKLNTEKTVAENKSSQTGSSFAHKIFGTNRPLISQDKIFPGRAKTSAEGSAAQNSSETVTLPKIVISPKSSESSKATASQNTPAGSGTVSKEKASAKTEEQSALLSNTVQGKNNRTGAIQTSSRGKDDLAEDFKNWAGKDLAKGKNSQSQTVFGEKAAKNSPSQLSTTGSAPNTVNTDKQLESKKQAEMEAQKELPQKEEAFDNAKETKQDQLKQEDFKEKNSLLSAKHLTNKGEAENTEIQKESLKEKTEEKVSGKESKESASKQTKTPFKENEAEKVSQQKSLFEDIKKESAKQEQRISKHENAAKNLDEGMQKAVTEAAARSEDFTKIVQKKRDDEEAASRKSDEDKEKERMDLAKDNSRQGESTSQRAKNSYRFNPERKPNSNLGSQNNNFLAGNEENSSKPSPDAQYSTKNMPEQNQTKNMSQSSSGNQSASATTQEMHHAAEQAGKTESSRVTRDAAINQTHNSTKVIERSTQAAAQHAATSIESIIKKSNKEVWSGDEMAAKLIYLLMKSGSEYTYEHSSRVIDLTMDLAHEMGIRDPDFLLQLRDGAMLRDIGQNDIDFDNAPPEIKEKLAEFLGEEQIKDGGFLHDIGKIKIPDEILYKPGKLTDEEFEVIKTHPSIGEQLLMGIPGLAHVLPVVKHHHEKWNGKGYPDGLTGENIPFSARIVALCDSFDAMVSDRPYRQGMSLEDALSEIKKGSGSQFDPLMAEIFVNMVEKKYA